MKYYNKMTVLILTAFLTIMALSGMVSAQTTVSSCQEIDTPGEYVLVQDITATCSCINITSSDVTIDGDGYTITGNASGSAIFANGSIDNITIRNVNIENFSTGIQFINSDVTGFTISDNTINTTNYGIDLRLRNICDGTTYATGDLIVADNIITSAGEGINLDAGYWGTNLSGGESCTIGDLKFNRNTINSTSYGIRIPYLEYLGYNMSDSSSFTMGDIEFNGNTINSTASHGIYVQNMRYFGSELFNASSVTMGNITFNDNTVDTQAVAGNGFDIDHILYYSGYHMYNYSNFTMGDIQVNNNTIDTGLGDGLYMKYVG